ncbi:MAG: hypothetical protein ACE5IR_10355 [bacterium]
MNVHRAIMVSLYTSGFVFIAMVAAKGFEYYNLPLEQRPHFPLHNTLKPGGVWGHGLGIMGSAMLLLLFIYSARKRQFLKFRSGKIRHWLNIHIFFGIMGPLLITLHTSFKFGGIVSVSYYSMLAVMLSGFVGRYLYVQIPRALSGDELSFQEMEEQNRHLARLLIDEYHVEPQLLAQIQSFAGVNNGVDARGLSVLLLILKNDLTRPFKIRALRKKLRRESRHLPADKINHLIRMINQKTILARKMALLSTVQPLFHYWHVVHKPFAYVMVIIMFLHIAVTLLFGYRWIF